MSFTNTQNSLNIHVNETFLEGYFLEFAELRILQNSIREIGKETRPLAES